MYVSLLVSLEKTKILLLTLQEAQKSLHRLQQQAALSRLHSDPHLTTGHGLEGMSRLKCEAVSLLCGGCRQCSLWEEPTLSSSDGSHVPAFHTAPAYEHSTPNLRALREAGDIFATTPLLGYDT